MLTASTPTPYMRDVAHVLSQPAIRIMACRIVGEHDGLDAISTVALRMAERERAGKPVPAKLDRYVCKAVRIECYKIYNTSKARASADIDEVTLSIEPECGDKPIEVEGLVLTAVDQIRPESAEQIRLSYWHEVEVRDAARRGHGVGTTSSLLHNGRKGLRDVPELHAAAHALGIGRVEFEPADRDAWARERVQLSRTCSGLQTLELIEVWTSLALRQGTDLEAVEDWAMRIVGATTEQMDVAEILIGQHWAPMRSSADMRGAA